MVVVFRYEDSIVVNIYNFLFKKELIEYWRREETRGKKYIWKFKKSKQKIE